MWAHTLLTVNGSILHQCVILFTMTLIHIGFYTQRLAVNGRAPSSGLVFFRVYMEILSAIMSHFKVTASGSH